MISKGHLIIQENLCTYIIIRAWYLVVRFKPIKAVSIVLSLKQVFTLVNMFSILQEKTITYQTEEAFESLHASTEYHAFPLISISAREVDHSLS